MIVANGPPIAEGGINRPERKKERKSNPPDMPVAMGCDGAKAATIKPRENIAAIERTIERTKYGIVTLNCAPKISSLPKITIKIAVNASTRLRIN